MLIPCLIVGWITVITEVTLSAHLDITPRNAVVPPGQNVSILCRANVSLTLCRIKLPSVEQYLNLNPKTKPTKEYAYHGKGLQSGECGITLFSVADKFNGEVTCTVGTDKEREESVARTNLIVARSPDGPEFTLSPSASGQGANYYREGDILQAKCVVKDGRPAANVTWYWGEDDVTNGSRTSVAVGKGLDLYTVTSYMTRQLSWRDNSRELRCVASQQQGGARNVVSRTINVTYAPRDVPKPIEQLGLIVGERGKVIVEVLANPKPTLTWVVGNISLAEGERNSDLKLVAADAEYLKPSGTDTVGSDQGRWRAVLTINQLTIKDLKREIYLKARNSEGERQYRVAFSVLTGIRSPKAPELTLSPSASGQGVNYYREGDTLQATCVVKDGRPAANLTWYWGVDDVTRGSQTSVAVDERLDLYTVTSYLTRQLGWTDNSGELRCVASQQQGGPRNQTSRTVNVTYAPRGLKMPIKQDGVIVGKRAALVVEVLANPQPSFTWLVGDIQIAERQRDTARRLEAAPAEGHGQFKWKAVLYINQVTKEDLKRDYYLTARNSEGERIYHVQISKPTETCVSGKRVGVYIAIGTAINIIVIATFLALTTFAWKKKRWCFASPAGMYDDPDMYFEEIDEGQTTPWSDRKVKNYMGPAVVDNIQHEIKKTEKVPSKNIEMGTIPATGTTPNKSAASTNERSGIKPAVSKPPVEVRGTRGKDQSSGVLPTKVKPSSRKNKDDVVYVNVPFNPGSTLGSSATEGSQKT